MADQDRNIPRSIEDLRRIRDELRVQVDLGRREARDQWTELEEKWQRLQENAKLAAEEGQQTGREVRETAGELIDELRDGYRRMRDALTGST